MLNEYRQIEEMERTNGIANDCNTHSTAPPRAKRAPALNPDS